MELAVTSAYFNVHLKMSNTEKILKRKCEEPPYKNMKEAVNLLKTQKLKTVQTKKEINHL